MELESNVREDGGLAVLELKGDITSGAEAELDRAYSASSARTILLNFAHVGYINSTGIALIVGVLARARKDQRTVMACGLSDHYREIFQITRLSDFMDMVENEAGAVAAAATK